VELKVAQNMGEFDPPALVSPQVLEDLKDIGGHQGAFFNRNIPKNIVTKAKVWVGGIEVNEILLP
tara:strand:- start:190 stop:384 length:195 start_codon:yes stop_codon:yes gene_type:complete